MEKHDVAYLVSETAYGESDIEAIFLDRKFAQKYCEIGTAKEYVINELPLFGDPEQLEGYWIGVYNFNTAIKSIDFTFGTVDSYVAPTLVTDEPITRAHGRGVRVFCRNRETVEKILNSEIEKSQGKVCNIDHKPI